MKPFFGIMKNPIAHLGKGVGGIFSCYHEDDETNLKAVGTWFALKFYMICIEVIMELIFVGIIIGYMGVAITWMLLGLILGFLASHLLWWIAVFYSIDVCCQTNRYVVTGVIAGLSGVLDLIGLFSHIGVYNVWPEYLAVDICGLLAAIPSFFCAAILLQLHMNIQKRGGSQTADGSAADGQVTVHVLPDDGAAPSA